MSGKTVQPYVFFSGRCEEAIEFYRKAVSAEVEMVMHYNQSPEPMPPGMVAPGFENKVMHTTFRVGGSTIMAADDCSGHHSGFHGFRLSLSVPTEADAERAFAALSDGGKVDMPLMKTFWAPSFGMLTDKFGIGWMVSVPGTPPK